MGAPMTDTASLIERIDAALKPDGFATQELLRDIRAELSRLTAALRAQAQEVERLKTWSDEMAIQFRQQGASDAQARIAELEAERDKWKAAAGSGQMFDLYREAKDIRNAIRSKTIEECAEYLISEKMDHAEVYANKLRELQ